MKEEQRFQKIFLNEKWRNTFIVKKHFPLEVIKEIIPIDSHCEREYGEFLKTKRNLKYYASLSNDSKFVAIIIKYCGAKHRRLLETISLEEFTAHYKIIDY